MSNFGNLQSASRLGRSIVTQVATAQTNATQFTTTFGSQTRQVRLVHTFTGGIWITLDSTAVVTANSSATLDSGQLPGIFYCNARSSAQLHQHQHQHRLCLAD